MKGRKIMTQEILANLIQNIWCAGYKEGKTLKEKEQ